MGIGTCTTASDTCTLWDAIVRLREEDAVLTTLLLSWKVGRFSFLLMVVVCFETEDGFTVLEEGEGEEDDEDDERDGEGSGTGGDGCG